MIEASADEALLNTFRNQLKEDEFVVVAGRLQMDFSGGLRVKVQQVWDLAGARCRFGKICTLPWGHAARCAASGVGVSAAPRNQTG